MSTKTCPSCGAEVPVSAQRCKDCFHDFNAAPARGGGGKGVLILLATLAAMAIAGSWIVSWMSSFPTSIRTLVNGENKTIQVIQQFQDGRVETDQVTFDQVARIEYSAGGQGFFELTAVTSDGKRLILAHDPKNPLGAEAESYAKRINKPLETIDKPPGQEEAP
jgi:hypothetical protein